MAYTITEKILLKHTPGKQDIHPGEFIWAKIDLSLANDITAPLAIEEFKKSGSRKVFNTRKIALVPDHFIPAKDLKSANQAKLLREFAKEQKIKNYFEVGQMGIEHALLPELGLVGPGDLVVGADSHTCTYGALGAFSTGMGSTDIAGSWMSGFCWFRVPETMKLSYKGKLKKWVGGKDLILYTIGDIGVDGALYKAMEFSGPVIARLGMDDRFAMCNMAIEAGGKSGIIEPDEMTFEYIKQVTRNQPALAKRSGPGKPETRKKPYGLNLKSDEDARYAKVKEYDVSDLEPQVACPHLPSNVKGVSQLKDVKVDQVVIGSCTNGRISDLRLAAKVMQGNKVKSGLRAIVIPATQNVYKQAIKEGLIETFAKAGCVISTSTCGPCLGGHCGLLADGETAIATTNRNFIGRMGSPKSFVYLSNPAVAAASAIRGRITHPENV
ncbi:MAG: 3-isopropylmalate dehydratase large subunit [Omnitrophica WOR_2 bacterium RIFCSPLOWO2_12_FULL_46_30]|nr:MAG: 3-isopropylmalate dehydratase large subunit [Omnitrophica WOR_2 bacterium RIFCSPHIGHO2_02_FULL_46_37]OGX42498.1 MAG: 3-isopropylmalate dehydratase large subunit [Omnitrophica WOR_2 bacterium RIFCSPLOWO2_02_FULL_45_28]OGX52333.1 MAG: 3-isopropylmalate dehydratase large subunit [Omnitrophica WOR_2 bacterium RIFCSPLOWO2_12_FULL_46_30]